MSSRLPNRGQAPSCACPTSAAAAVDCACLPPPTGNLDRSIADERKPAVCQSTNLRYAHNSAPDEIFRPVSSPASRILSSSPSRKHIHKPADMVIPAPDPRARIGGSFETAELTTHRTTSRLRTPRASRPCSMYERFPMQAGHWPRTVERQMIDKRWTRPRGRHRRLSRRVRRRQLCSYPHPLSSFLPIIKTGQHVANTAAQLENVRATPHHSTAALPLPARR